MVKIKAESRKWAKKTRKLLDITSISDLICQNIKSADFFTKNKNIMAYYAINSEVDVSQLFEDTNKNWFLPVCDLKNETINPHKYCLGDVLAENELKIKEPLSTTPIISTDEIDIIIVPALLGDINGNRIGYGAGYYDKFLSRIGSNTKTVMCLPDCLLLSTVPSDEWDRKIDYIVTEKRFLQIL